MIHTTAIVSNKAKIGKNVKIGPFCIIGDNVELADEVELKSHIVLEGNTYIGRGSVLFPFVSINIPQTLAYKGEPSQVRIGQNCVLREYVTVQHGTRDGRMLTSIGDNCLLMVGVHIAHNCDVGNNVIFANYVSLAGHVQVGDFAIIGGLSAVHQYVRVGAHSMVGGMSALDRDLIPFGLATNDRAHLEGLNLVGMNRRGFNKRESLEASRAIKEMFAYKASGVLAERVAHTAAAYPENVILQTICSFLKQEQSRGYCKLQE